VGAPDIIVLCSLGVKKSPDVGRSLFGRAVGIECLESRGVFGAPKFPGVELTEVGRFSIIDGVSTLSSLGLRDSERTEGWYSKLLLRVAEVSEVLYSIVANSSRRVCSVSPDSVGETLASVGSRGTKYSKYVTALSGA